MCEQCAPIESFSDAELAPYAGETSDIYEVAVMNGAVRVVQFRSETNEQLAARVGVSKTTLYRWLRYPLSAGGRQRAFTLLEATRERDARPAF